MKIKNNCLTYEQIIENPNLLLNKFIFINYQNGCGYDIFYFYKIDKKYLYFFKKDVYFTTKECFYFDFWLKKTSLSVLVAKSKLSQIEII